LKEIGDFVQFDLVEDDARVIPANRLSDGTLRYLSLLAILCDPAPASLVCIEEPELGLHPDIISTIAKLLIEASQRTQLIVTTHSADIVSALWEFPESVVVCERDSAGSRMQRLDSIRLKKWLERYSLGELWLSGEIGGKRW
jgi:predicted ATPase